MDNNVMTTFLEQLYRTISLSKIFMTSGIISDTAFNLLALQIEDLENAYNDVAVILENL